MSKVIKKWTIEIVVEEDGQQFIHRENKGFSPFELLGICEDTKTDILMQTGRITGYVDKELHCLDNGETRTIKHKDKS